MSAQTKQRKIGKSVVIPVILVIILLFAFFLREILIPLIKMELARDTAGATALLQEKGIMGYLAVILVEALQMVVVFIPAEFIQISSGLSYPFHVALALCDAGVCLGATIIFTLVRVLNVRNDIYEKQRSKINRMTSAVRDRNTVILLYLLFFMPMVPFGAICYYASGTDLKYRRYLLTVATGVIPSIAVSNLMGLAGTAFLMNSMPMWILVIIIAALAVLLFLLIGIFMRKVCFKGTDNTPDSFMYSLVFSVVRIWHGSKQRIAVNDELLEKVKAPYVLLCNHESFFDFYYISKLNHPRNPAYMVNAFYCIRPVLRWIAKESGMIPKKLFTPDSAAILKTMKTIRNGFPVVIFPEGRLSPDGRSNIFLKGARFYKKLDCPLVLTRIDGAYLSNPKWRGRRFRSNIKISVERVISREELQSFEDEELEKTIKSVLYNDATLNNRTLFLQPDKARGLENLLYRCPDCGSLYTTRSFGNAVFCTSCKASHTLDNRYRFKGFPHTIPQWYDMIKEAERKELDGIRLNARVNTKIFTDDGKVRKEKGECTLTEEGFSYKSESMEFFVEIDVLPALAFSCAREFELYHGNELCYFYPEENPQQVTRWSLIVDILNEKRNEKENAD